ncbi:YHS domain-containing protein, partial [Bosea spartocytisi]
MADHQHHGGHRHDDHSHHHHGHSHGAAESVKDPVCGMTVDPATAKHRAAHAGQTYFFCSARCQNKFEADPAAYVREKAEKPASKPAPEGTIYTCPMHPQIRQPGPGNCPICGMALEPEIATLQEGPSAELVDMTRRLWVGLVLAVPVFLLEMGGHLVDLHMLLSQQSSNWLQLILATPVVLWAGWPFFQRAWA